MDQIKVDLQHEKIKLIDGLQKRRLKNHRQNDSLYLMGTTGLKMVQL